jgi:hypothetical protein
MAGATREYQITPMSYRIFRAHIFAIQAALAQKNSDGADAE